MAKASGSGIRFLGMVGGLVLLIVASRFHVPMYPEPTTLVSMIVVLLGVLVGWREGAIIACLYLAAVIVGLPTLLWHGHFEIEPFWQVKTSGYVVGLIAAAALAGKLAPQAAGAFSRVFLAMLAGHAVYLLAGSLWLLRFTSLHSALIEGIVPYLVPVLAKSAAAFLVAVGLRKFV